MAEKSAQEIIQSIIGAVAYAEEQKKQQGNPVLKPVVTISRFFGAGGTDVARLLAERLGVQLYDQELLKEVIKTAKADKFLMAKMDERVTSLMEDFVQSLLSSKAISKDDFIYHLAKVALGIAESGGVIVGRGTNMILTQGQAFRVRIDGSMSVCVERVAKNLVIKKKKAEKLILAENEERARFAAKVAKRFPSDRYPFELIISTDTFTPGQAVNLILAGMKEAGFPVP